MMVTDENELAHQVIGMAIDIHKNLGPGLPKEIYLQCMQYELQQNGLTSEINKELPIHYKNLVLESGYVLDILIENNLIVCIETCDNVVDSHIQKMLKMLRLGQYKLGLVINFNSSLLKNGIRRVTNHKNQEEN